MHTLPTARDIDVYYLKTISHIFMHIGIGAVSLRHPYSAWFQRLLLVNIYILETIY